MVLRVPSPLDLNLSFSHVLGISNTFFLVETKSWTTKFYRTEGDVCVHTLKRMRRLILFERDATVRMLMGWSGDRDIFTTRLSRGDLH